VPIDHIDIEKFSFDELVQLNRRIIRRLQYLQTLKTQTVMDKFQVGDKVFFHSGGKHIEGVVIRVNRKTLSVHTQDADWNIHPGMVSKVTEQKSIADKILEQGFASDRKNAQQN
jgi:preprotein translocase subunit YajC